jgi:PAS domain S-box-containing protein
LKRRGLVHCARAVQRGAPFLRAAVSCRSAAAGPVPAPRAERAAVVTIPEKQCRILGRITFRHARTPVRGLVSGISGEPAMNERGADLAHGQGVDPEEAVAEGGPRAGAPLRDDLQLFAVVAVLGFGARFLSVNIPHTDLYIEGSLAFGLIGFALLHRGWLAALLVLVLSAAGFTGDIAFHTKVLGNLSYSVPVMVATRLVNARLFRPINSLAVYGIAWVVWVLLCYQVFITPIVSVVVAVLEDQPLVDTVLAGWWSQPFVVESLMVAVVAASGLVVLRSRAMIARSQHELEVTLQSIGDAVIATDLNGLVTRMNPEACRLTGWAAGEAVGRPLNDVLRLVNTKTGAPLRSPVAHALQAGRRVVTPHNTTLIDRAGERRQIGDSAAPIRDTDGRLLGVVMVFRDATQAYDAREIMAHRKRQLDLALDAAGMGIWDWDIKSDHLDWTGHQARLFGLKPHEFDGRLESTQALVHPDDWDETIAGALATAQEGTPFDQSFRSVWPDGSVHWLHAVAKLVRDGTGAPWRVIGITQDITERKHSEEQLRETLDALTRSNVELERFAYVAAHDLQEPIRSMVAYSQLLQTRYHERLDEDARAFLGFIIDGAKRMQALVLDLLDYSRVNVSSQPFRPVDLNAVVGVVRANLDHTIRAADARIDTQPLPVVLGDQAQLVSVMQNLIGDAVKFHRPGVPPRVRISAEAAENGTVAIDVADNGVGIAPQDQDRVFEIFKRLYTVAEYPGTGVGLTLAKRIVERHGGTITLDSVPDQGSRFRVVLPLPPDDVA